jgi:hypothetical protein
VTTARGAEVVIQSFAGSSWIVLCSTASTENGITADQCKTVYATLLSAQLTHQQVQLWFSDALTCATQPAWGLSTGWYYGPEIVAGN